MKKRKAIYPGTEAVLYLIVQVVCDLYVNQLKAFSLFKKKYTQAFVDDILQSLKAAEALPNNNSRQGRQSKKRTTLDSLNVTICNQFQKLMLYITDEDAFEKNDWSNLQKIAGSDFYLAASSKNWAASKTMQSMAIDFMNAYPTELAAGGMPDDFAADFVKQNTAYLAALLAFSSSKSTTGEETADKTGANNALYTRIQALMTDGRRIFEDKPATRDQFSYHAQMVKLGGQGNTGFRFALVAAETLVPVKLATVRLLPTGNSFDADENGIIMVNVPEGDYTYTLVAEGYEPVTGTLAARTGVRHRVNLILKPVAMAAMPEPTGMTKIG